MPSPATLDALVAALPGQRFNFMKPSATAEGAGTWHSLWAVNGFPLAGATPTVIGSGGSVPTNTTTGAIPFTNPGATPDLYLARLALAGQTAGTLIIYDRLWHCSGFVGNVTTAQNVTSPVALTRPDANGAGVEIWGEVYSAMGATAATFTISYTDQDGNAGASATYAHPANALSVGQMVPFTLAAGDTGCRSIASLTLNVSTGTAGNFGVTLLRRIAEIPLFGTAAPLQVMDAFSLGLPLVYDNACLAGMVLCSTTNTGLIQGSLNLVET